MDARTAAFLCLERIVDKKSYSNLALNSILSENRMDRREKALATNLVYGVLSHLTLLDYNIEKLSTRRLNKLTPCVVWSLRMALYQIWMLDRIPKRAAVHQGVCLAREHGGEGAGAYVNAVLRKAPDAPIFPAKGSLCHIYSVTYSFPDWMVGRFLKELGQQQTELLLQAFLRPAEMCIRINGLKPECQIPQATPHPHVEGCFVAKDVDLIESASFKAGRIAISDGASQMAAILLDPQKGDKVLDMCAAPGGKTAHLADIMGNSGSITACDIHPHKIKLINQTLDRLGVKNTKTLVADATSLCEEFLGAFDKILLDAPCSGFGVVRRKPEIKWTKTYEDICEMAKQSMLMLNNGARYLKVGGQLVFSTCTITHEENQDNINNFLKNHPSFELLTMKTFYPHIDETDGFFVAKLRKKT